MDLPECAEPLHVQPSGAVQPPTSARGRGGKKASGTVHCFLFGCDLAVS